MRIGDLAKVLQVSKDTIRRLEKRGLLNPARDWAGHRRFSEQDLARARKLLFSRSTEPNLGHGRKDDTSAEPQATR